ncbi:hypothetical protein [Bradyrhizobium sp. dw_78]|uniref:hypothetical protein n=1 Tax=Bradyrhizobium sp. dw_78 TaxID=2719793 RepID=UPI001BD52A36|nr:hypothetical protein [Bradyrhizobium sp. dw_78]
MLRKTFFVLAAIASIGVIAPDAALARGGFHGGGFHGGFGGWHGGGWRGGRGWGWGLGALGAGAALGYGLYGPYGYYGSPYYDDGYDGGGCYVVRRRVHTPRGWRIRPVEICD